MTDEAVFPHGLVVLDNSIAVPPKETLHASHLFLARLAAIAPDRTILVHGEEKAMTAFAEALHGTKVLMPEQGESIDL